MHLQSGPRQGACLPVRGKAGDFMGCTHCGCEANYTEEQLCAYCEDRPEGCCCPGPELGAEHGWNNVDDIVYAPQRKNAPQALVDELRENLRAESPHASGNGWKIVSSSVLTTGDMRAAGKSEEDIARALRTGMCVEGPFWHDAQKSA